MLENLSTSRMSSSSGSSRSSSLPSSESLPTSSSVANTGGRKRSIRFDLSMDLTHLWQAIFYSDLFHRGSPAMEEMASELAHHDQQRFQGLSRKAVRDRILLLVEQHKREDFARKQYVRLASVESQVVQS